MGTGWRRAFCTSIPQDSETTISEKQQRSPSPSPSPSPRSYTKLAFLTGGSNPSTPLLQSQPVSSPSLRCRTTTPTAAPTPPLAHDSPRLQCKTATTKSPRMLLGSNPTSPKSPSRFSLFKTSLRLSRSSCGICSQSVKTGQRTAIFTAECSHAFHFPCISAHVKEHGNLVCPVCNANWREVPLLPFHRTQRPHTEEDETAQEVEENNKEKKGDSLLQDINIQNKQQQQQNYQHSDTRAYDDDEPLLSPTTGGRFNPIPEADENGEEENEGEEIEEFQGFFVNPNPSSSNQTTTNAINMRNVTVKLLPEVAVVSVGRSHETYAVALKVKAPPPPARNSSTSSLLDPARRAPIDLVTVLDVSGSMTGAKLQMLKRAMRLVISSLGSADRLSIVAFSAAPKRLLPLRRMTVHGQRSARRIIDRLVCGQGTSVGDALRKATKVLEDRRDRNPVASIMLLSDGQEEHVSNTNSTANRRCRSSTTHVSSTRFAHLEIPVHAFGFGDEPAEDAFAKCVGGLLSVVVQDLRLQLGFAHGSAPVEITTVYSCNGRPTVLGTGGCSMRLGDLYAEEERELLVELKVPVAAVESHQVMSVRCCFKDPATQQIIIYGKEEALPVPPPQAVRSSAPKIERLRNLFVTTRAVAEARRVMEHNDLSSAYHLLSSARALLMQSSSISADEYLRGLEVELAELHWLRQHQQQQIQQQQQQQQQQNQRRNSREQGFIDENGEPLTPTSAWRAAERLAKVAMMRKSLNRVSDLHGFENARF